MGSTQKVTVNGVTLNTRVDGKEGAPWLVFSNSLATDLSMWDGQIEPLQEKFRILRYDQRGHGASAPPPAGTTFDDLAGDLIGLLKHFATGKAVLAGVSMGAVTVLRVAARTPELCRAVIACDGQWMTPSTGKSAWDERIALAKGQGMQALAKPTVKRWFTADFYERLPQTAAKVEAMVAATPFAGYAGCAEALQDYDFRADFPKLSVPVLYIVGEEDGLMPAVMREMAEATPGGRFHGIAKAGHLPNLERPEEFMAAVNGFLTQV